MASFEISYPRLRADEGGKVNDPVDLGGKTNAGITQRSWDAFRASWIHTNSDLPVDVWDLSDDMIKSFYLLQNWLPIKGKFIGDQRLADFLFSMSVLEGVSAAVKRLQGILQVTADGIMGTKTLEAIESEDEDSLIRRYGAANLAFYKAIVKHDPTQQRFLAGWTARLNHYEAMT